MKTFQKEQGLCVRSQTTTLFTKIRGPQENSDMTIWPSPVHDKSPYGGYLFECVSFSAKTCFDLFISVPSQR